MNPILHALFARPFDSEFMRQRGSVHTEWCDRDNLIFDAKGNMVIGADGLPILNGVPQEFEKRKRKKNTGAEFICQKAIVDALQNGVLHTRTELSDVTGFSRPTVAKYLNILKRGGTVEMIKKKQGNKNVEYFKLSDK